MLNFIIIIIIIIIIIKIWLIYFVYSAVLYLILLLFQCHFPHNNTLNYIAMHIGLIVPV
jgi:hypothetical protein